METIENVNAAPSKFKRKGKPIVTATAMATATIAWVKADGIALVSQGKAVSIAIAALRSLGGTHEERNGEWRPTKRFIAFRTDYMLQCEKALGDTGKDKAGIVLRFALRAMRVNLTADAMSKTIGKVQDRLEHAEKAWKKSGRAKTDHSQGGTSGAGGRPIGGEVISGTDRVLAYLDKQAVGDVLNAIGLWARKNKQAKVLSEALAK